MSITAVVENGSVKLPMVVPDGTRVEITFPKMAGQPATNRGTIAQRYAKYVGIADALPSDFAVNHDHYLHGAPKQA